MVTNINHCKVYIQLILLQLRFIPFYSSISITNIAKTLRTKKFENFKNIWKIPEVLIFMRRDSSFSNSPRRKILNCSTLSVLVALMYCANDCSCYTYSKRNAVWIIAIQGYVLIFFVLRNMLLSCFVD